MSNVKLDHPDLGPWTSYLDRLVKWSVDTAILPA